MSPPLNPKEEIPDVPALFSIIQYLRYSCCKSGHRNFAPEPFLILGSTVGIVVVNLLL